MVLPVDVPMYEKETSFISTLISFPGVTPFIFYVCTFPTHFLREIKLEAFLYFYQLISSYKDKQPQLTADQK